jgi:hypothetical protein
MAMRIPDYPDVETTPVTRWVKKGKLTQERYYRCGVCGYLYPESEFEVFEGKRYCHKHRCYEDIADIVEDRIAKKGIPHEGTDDRYRRI